LRRAMRARPYNTRLTQAEYRGAPEDAAIAHCTIELRYRIVRHKRFSLIVRST